MERRQRTGSWFATLRNLRGLSIAEAARAASLSVEDVEAAEWGTLTESTTTALSSLYGLSPKELLIEALVRPEQSDGMTVFLLNTANQDFRAADLRPLERSLRAARIFAALSPGAPRSIGRRMMFVQTPVAGPLPRDAAKQGYALADRVRTELGLGHAPLTDLRKLLEDRLAIAVMVDELRTHDLRAASVLDAGRTAAAVLLSSVDGARDRNPRLARVYLAHELAHLLFDRARPGCVQIALDDCLDIGDESRRGSAATALMESRAKAFAAELLLPRAGVVDLLGRRLSPEASVQTAVQMVLTAAEHFGTPWEIAVYHLTNLKFIDHELKSELIDEWPTRGESIATSLPVSGAAPLCFEGVSDAVRIWNELDVLDSAAPPFVAGAVATARRAAHAAVSDVLERAYADADAGRVIAATDPLVWRLDRWLAGGEFEQVSRVLAELDVTRLPPPVLTAVLTLTSHAKEPLGGAHTRFLDRVLLALEGKWGFPPERRAKLAARLG